MPLYTMVAHTTTPYAEAVARARRQERVLAATVAGTAAAGVLGLAGLLRRRGRDRGC